MVSINVKEYKLLKIVVKLATRYLVYQESCCFSKVLHTFSAALGKTINIEKSQLFFFNTDLITKCNVSRILDFSISSLPSKYLEAPLFYSTIKHFSCKYILEKLENKISSWNFKTLNLASRLTHIQFILQQG